MSQKVIRTTLKGLVNNILADNPALTPKEVSLHVISAGAQLKRPPTLWAIQKQMLRTKEARKRIAEKQIDIPWCLGAMATHPGISSEAVPYIFVAQSFSEQFSDSGPYKLPQPPVTIRQAIWISRLYGLMQVPSLRQFVNFRGKKLIDVAIFLYNWSRVYARKEILHELSSPEAPLDTKELDASMRQGGNPLTTGDNYLVLQGNKILAVDDKLREQIEASSKDGE